MCRKCGLRPCLPSRARVNDYVCGPCHYNKPCEKRAQKRKWDSERYRAWDRERCLAKANPLRAAFRAIGLEAHNLATKGKWRG